MDLQNNAQRKLGGLNKYSQINEKCFNYKYKHTRDRWMRTKRTSNKSKSVWYEENQSFCTSIDDTKI